MSDEDIVTNITTAAAAVGAAAVARKALTAAWEKRRGSSPGDPTSPETPWGEAIAWGLISGAVLGVVRLVAQRSVAQALGAKATGPAAALTPGGGEDR